MAKEIRKKDPKTGAEKGTKLERHDLIPVPALRRLATHYGVGSQKYAEHNWRKGYAWSWSYAALCRHLNAFWQGEDIDPETGSRHITAVAWHALALDTFMDEHLELDDRFVAHQLEKAKTDVQEADKKERIQWLLDKFDHAAYHNVTEKEFMHKWLLDETGAIDDGKLDFRIAFWERWRKENGF